MNIAFGKFGKSIKFKQSKWGIHGGDAAPSILITALAKLNPEDTFYMIGRSDLSKIPINQKKKLFPNNNVVDIWNDYKRGSYKTRPDATFKSVDYKYPVNWMNDNDIKMDFGLFMSGPLAAISIPYTFYKIQGDTNEFCKTMSFAENYGANIINFINETDTPYLNVVEDPRYFPLQSRDLFRSPNINLGQYNGKAERRHHKSVDDQKIIKTEEEIKYSGVETIFAMAEEAYDIDYLVDKKLSPTSKFMNLYLNQGLGSGGTDRGPIVEEWILDNFNRDDILIHGKWNKPWSEHDQFTPTMMSELVNEMEKTKYTLIVPIQSDWVTSKFWKMLHFGILPFMHPDYDTQKSIPCDDFLRVETKEEYKNKVQYLERNADEYESILRNSMNLLQEEIYNGKRIVENVYNEMYQILGVDENYELNHDKLMLPISSFETELKSKKLF